ncbi:Translin-associated factor X-interacting protein 1 [Trebouxia sp. C0010 RCD-2024]
MASNRYKRQANFLFKEATTLNGSRRLTLPPDPSNTRIQGAYVDIWELSSKSRTPERFAARSHSSLEFRTPIQVSAESSAYITDKDKAPSAAIISAGVQDPPNVPHSPASTQVKPLLGTRQVWQLAKWLETETLQFNQTFSERAMSSPALEFLLLATRSARQLHSKAFYELTKQVTEGCRERGELMADVWIGYTTVLETVMARMNQLCLQDRDRAVVAESEKRNLAGVLGEEIQTLHIQNRGLRDETDVLKKQLQELVSTAGAAAGRRPRKVTKPVEGPLGALTGQKPPGTTKALVSFPGTEPLLHAVVVASNPASLALSGRYNSVLNDGLFSSLQMREGSIINDLAESEPAYLAKQNKELRRLLVECRKELYEAYEKTGELERQTDQIVPLQSKLELAVNERDAAIAKAEGLTPRPGVRAVAGVSPEGCKKLDAALTAHRTWPSDDLAKMLLGEEDSQHHSLLQSAPFVCGCLAKALADKALTRQDVASALAQASLQPFLAHLTGQQLAWLQRHMQLTSQLTAQGKSLADLVNLIDTARIPTARRVATLEAEIETLKGQLADPARRNPSQSGRAAVDDDAEGGDRADAAGRQREQEELATAPNPINEYVEMLEEEDEANLKADFPSMGNTPEIPRVFKTNGRVRNKNVTKRQTEMLVKEIWKVRMTHRKAGKAGVPLPEMMFLHLQKTKGLHQAVIETGYNLLYGCLKYSWDADCELFLKILRGEVKEEVYVEQIQLQEELEALFIQLDKAKGRATSSLNKGELGDALKAFFRVGQPGGKTEDRHDELMQALDEDQPGSKVIYKKLFEEDREYNQGEFAEAVRDQFLNERIEYYKELEDAIANAAAAEGMDMCTREHVKAALRHLDPDVADHVVGNISASVFNTGQDQHSLPVIMKRLQNITIKRSRGTFNKLSIINKTKALVASKKKLKADQLKTDVITPGINDADILPGADGQVLQAVGTVNQGTKWKAVADKVGEPEGTGGLAAMLLSMNKGSMGSTSVALPALVGPQIASGTDASFRQK